MPGYASAGEIEVQETDAYQGTQSNRDGSRDEKESEGLVGHEYAQDGEHGWLP